MEEGGTGQEEYNQLGTHEQKTKRQTKRQKQETREESEEDDVVRSRCITSTTVSIDQWIAFWFVVSSRLFLCLRARSIQDTEPCSV